VVLFAGAGGASAAGATASHLHVMRLENVVRLLLSRLFFAFHTANRWQRREKKNKGKRWMSEGKHREQRAEKT